MKKTILSLLAAVACMSINAQVIKVYKSGTTDPVATYTNTTTDQYKVVFEEAPAATPSKLLPGEFSVSATKTVQFTKSNLYWDGTAFNFEADQTDCLTSWNANHVSQFFWSSTASVAYAKEYSDDARATSDKFFCGESNKITVEGTSGLYALSKDEWTYLIKARANATNLCKYGQTVGGKANCFLIAPDDFDSSKWHSSNSYTIDEVNSLGLVCLPATGYRNNNGFVNASYGYYSSSTPNSTSKYNAYHLEIKSTGSSSLADAIRGRGCCLRLVK